jgi:hypothetical protein
MRLRRWRVTASCVQLPCEHDAADFDWPPFIALPGAACSFYDRSVPVQLDNAAAIEQPKQALVIAAGKRSLSVAAK